MANNRIAVLVALVGADDGFKRALQSVQQSLGELATIAKTAGDKAGRWLERANGLKMVDPPLTWWC